MVTVSVVESTTEFFERERSFMMKSPNVPLNFYAFRVMVILGGYFILF